MSTRRFDSLFARFTMVLVVAIALGASTSQAQSKSVGAIAGSVKDESGHLMSGVTIEATSPALIEKSRTVVTNDAGEYKIENLRPGIYTVTFSSQGFATIKHEGLELNTGVTLPIDASMKVASVSETVTVTTATPVVDVQNTSLQSVLTEKTLTAVPTGMGIPGYTEITLGATQSSTPDVGGNKGEELDSILIHDSRSNDDDELLDGMSFSSGQSTGGLGQRSVVINKISVQEITVSTGSASAEAGHPGANVNVVPKTGSDQLHGAVNYTAATGVFQSQNLNPALEARGLQSGENIKETYDLGVGIGGPIFRGKLWFWAGYGQWNAENYAPGNYYNSTQNTLFYTPDMTRQAYTENYNYASDIRLDWQISKKNRVSLYQSYQDFCLCFFTIDTSPVSPEAGLNDWNRASFLTQAAWEGILSEKLLLRVGYTSALAPGRVNAYTAGVTSADVPLTLQNTGYQYHAATGLSGSIYGRPIYDEQNGVATVSYVTGSHAFKAGYTWQWNNQNFKEDPAMVTGIGPVSYVLTLPSGATQPVPYSITEYAAPLHFTTRSWVEALYFQDQWTLHRVTLNLGLRYDWERGYAPAQTEAATAFTPQHTFSALGGIPNWNDIEPRLGAAYDIFGNAKSAIRGSIGRFVLGDYTTTAVANSPANAIVTSATRTWTMTPAEIAASGGNYVPNCVLTNTAANGDCGALSNNGFGGESTSTSYDPAILSGWNVRPYNWQLTVQYEQQLHAGIGANVGYYRTWYGNFTATENTAVPANQYGTFCITGPADSRVSALNGSQVCGFHDVNPSYYGKVQSLVTKASAFGGQSEVYNGFDASVHASFKHGAFVAGGISMGDTANSDCPIANNYPNVTATQTNPLGNVTSSNLTPAQFCSYSIGWARQLQLKAFGYYPLPWKTQASFTYQNLPGLPFNTSYVATNAQIAPSLGRNLSSGASSETLTNALYSPFSVAEPRLSQLDLRFTKIFEWKKRFTTKINFDIYNINNANSVLTENATYSATNSYMKPTAILGARLFKLGANFNF
jgi:hypothetical protein